MVVFRFVTVAVHRHVDGEFSARALFHTEQRQRIDARRETQEQSTDLHWPSDLRLGENVRKHQVSRGHRTIPARLSTSHE